MPMLATNGAPGSPRGARGARGGDQARTMIRHAGLGASLPIGSLAMPVSSFAGLRLLIAAVGRTSLLPRLFAA